MWDKNMDKEQLLAPSASKRLIDTCPFCVDKQLEKILRQPNVHNRSNNNNINNNKRYNYGQI